MTLIDQFTSAHNAMVSNKFPVNARVLLYTLIGEWNRQRRPGVFSLTYASMSDLSGIPRGSIAKSLKYLKDRNIVKTHKTAGGLIDIRFQVASEYLLKKNEVASENSAVNTHARKPRDKETESAHVQEGQPPDEDRRTPNSKFAGMTLAEILASKCAADAKSNPSPEKGGES